MSELTDLEICKLIAEIEGYDFTYDRYNRPYILKMYMECNEHPLPTLYNPLTDDALCFKLMVKYRVWRWSNPYCGVFNVCIRGVQGWVTSVTFNKAICLAIIEANTND